MKRSSKSFARAVHFFVPVFVALVLAQASLVGGQTAAACAYDEAAYSFRGTPVEQARCLLRPVGMHGRLGAQLRRLPAPLENLVGRPVTVGRGALRQYLAAHNISEAEIGGPLDAPLSHTSGEGVGMRVADYFVIHDVSTPNYLQQAFPSNINERSWEWNDLERKWRNLRVAHLYINRLGESVAAVDFGATLPEKRFGTKFARDRLKESGKGLQLHIELVQPRRRDPAGSPQNDAIAPVPGFTQAQLDRLALVYISASVRRGRWLIPAFHAVVDAGIPDAHDDPQNFDTDAWARRLDLLLSSLDGQQSSPSRVSDDAPQRWTIGATGKEVVASTRPATLRAVRAARHSGFDRVVFEFYGRTIPGYSVEYVDRPVRQCGSGLATRIAGDAWLAVRLRPAQAHDERGRATVRQREMRLRLGVLRELESVCDFEADVEWVLGLASPNPYRVFELSNPARLVIDVRHRTR